MTDLVLLEIDTLTSIGLEDGSGSVDGEDLALQTVDSLLIHPPNESMTAGQVRFPNRTFVMTFGQDNRGDEMQDIFERYRDSIKVESAGQEDFASARVPEFVEMWTGDEFQRIIELPGAEIQTAAAARLVSLDYVEGDDQFLFYGPIETFVYVHAAVAAASVTSFRQISHTRLFESEDVGV